MRPRGAAAALLLLCAAGCTRMAKLTNLEASSCSSALRTGLARALESRGTPASDADELAAEVVGRRALARLGPRAFLVEAPDGTDYSFFIERKKDACLLRLYGEQKGFWSRTDNLFYIDTEPLPGCACTE